MKKLLTAEMQRTRRAAEMLLAREARDELRGSIASRFARRDLSAGLRALCVSAVSPSNPNAAQDSQA